MNRLFFSKKQSVDRGFFKKMDCIAFYDSPLGKITMASDGAFLIGLWFNGARYFAESLFAEHQEKNCPIFDETRRWLDSAVNCCFFKKKKTLTVDFWNVVAERGGFEPPSGYYPEHAFQACDLNHSSISPWKSSPL